jgi:hypothetical protein
MLPVLLEHKKLIGKVLSVKLDNYGIHVVLGLWQETPQQYLSIGFEILKYEIVDNVRIIKSINILEVSLVHNPSQKEQLCKIQKYN